jgi:hypothetical protein
MTPDNLNKKELIDILKSAQMLIEKGLKNTAIAEVQSAIDIIEGKKS